MGALYSRKIEIKLLDFLSIPIIMYRFLLSFPFMLFYGRNQLRFLDGTRGSITNLIKTYQIQFQYAHIYLVSLCNFV